MSNSNARETLPRAAKAAVQFSVNGTAQNVEVFPMARLLDVLREDLGLTGAKEGCGEGECGACSVLIDGELVNSCLIPAMQVSGAEITTIEGLPSGRLQDAFLQAGAAQCGICTPGMIMAAWYLLQRVPHPSRDEIREALGGNLCRCTGYQKICDAVEAAV
ncbi:MAG: (2Fe-2S)-binding protein [Bryobacteraceae bacterium]